MGHERVKSVPPRLPLEIYKSTGVHSLNTIPSSQFSVWTKYVQIGHIDLNVLIIVAERKEPSHSIVLVRQTKREKLDRKLRIQSNGLLNRATGKTQDGVPLISHEIIYTEGHYGSICLDFVIPGELPHFHR
jgi:hypothetical protein